MSSAPNVSGSVRTDSSGETLHVIVEKIEVSTREASHEYGFNIALSIAKAYAEQQPSDLIVPFEIDPQHTEKQ